MTPAGLACEASLAARKMGGAVPCAAECSPIPPRSARLATNEEEGGWRQNISYRPLFLVLISRQIKTGSLRRSERNGRYNRLMEIAIRAATRSLASRR